MHSSFFKLGTSPLCPCHFLSHNKPPAFSSNLPLDFPTNRPGNCFTFIFCFVFLGGGGGGGGEKPQIGYLFPTWAGTSLPGRGHNWSSTVDGRYRSTTPPSNKAPAA
uniref:Uncharacterized protein n=1 Tax=Sphaerodactylus townsendi TaxID=933632 RepID=A0ACB8EW66_9SAUR